MNDKLIGFVLAACLGLSAFSLKFAFDANAEIKSMQATNRLQFEQIQRSLDSMSNEDQSITKMWKLHSWAKDQINDLRYKNELNPVSWPDLD
jgi:hypothetical protein